MNSGTLQFLAGGGEASRLIADRDWSGSLGPVADWPESLKTTVSLMVHSPVPMVLLWGADGIMLYNDAYSGFSGGRHPQLLGSKVREGWPEVADFNDNVMKVGLAGGTLAYREHELVLDRSGTPQSAWMNLYYSPVIDESGLPGGVIAIVVEVTDRVLTQRAMVAERDRLAQMFEQAPSFIAVLEGPQHRFVLANPAYHKLIGGRTILGLTVAEALPDAAAQGYVALLDDVYRSGTAFRASGSEFAMRAAPDAPVDRRWLDFVYQPITDATGTVTGVFVEGVDVTEQYAARNRSDALARLSERLRDLEDEDSIAEIAAEILGTILQASRVGYGTIDAVADTLHVARDWTAPAADSLAGVTQLREYGSFIDSLKRNEFIAIADVRTDARTASAAAALEARQARAFVNVPVVEQGRLVAVLFVNNAAVHDWSPVELDFIREVAQRTRTAMERARAQEQLRESEARLRFLDTLGKATAISRDADEILAVTTQMVGVYLDLSNCAYADMDEDEDGFTIRGDWAAPGSQSILGHYSLAAFGKLAVARLGAGLPLIVNDNFAELAPEEAAAFQALGIAATICMPLVKGGKLTALMAIHDRNPRRWSGDELAIIREVTERSWAHIERARSEGALRELNATLEQRVRERTDQLVQTEEALRQAQKMEAVGQLTGGIAHDFNNLLAGISGSLEMLERRLADGRLSGLDRYISAAQGASRRAAALTQRLLAFSRRQTLAPKPTDVKRLIAGMEDLIRRSVGPDIEVEVVGSGGLWLTKADPSQLENSLLNLCINARDAMAPHGGRITIETANKWLEDRAARERDLQPGQYVSLCVTDTGTGMPPDVINRAFDPFFTTKPIGEGTGLGLSMVYGFARQSGGQVRIYSEVGKGTTVCLYLPRFTGEADLEEIPVPTAPDAGDGEVVLIVDDEPTIRMLAVEMLEESGYRTMEAGDGAAALRILQSDTRIDLLVTDVGLPGGMNGRQVADAARSSRPRLKVLFMTGFAENAVIGNGHLLPGMALITKPFVMSALVTKVREMIDADR